MRAVCYIRVSTDQEDQKNSMQTQQAEFKAWVEKNGYEIAENCGVWYSHEGTKVTKGLYADEGITGTSLKNRKAFKKMMEDAKKRKFDIIFVKDIKRFARSVEDFTKNLKDLKEFGIGVWFELLKLNSLDNSKEFIINLFASLAQEESNALSQSVQVGIRRIQKLGKWNAQIPYGYDVENGYLKINPKEAEIVKLIFDLYLNKNYGTAKIMKYLNEHKIPTKRGKVIWRQRIIRLILQNPIYVGQQITHRSITIDVNRKLRKEIPEEEQIIHYFPHLQIIDNETFEAVQKELKKRLEMFENNHRPSNVHLFSNLIYCGHCNTNFRRKRRQYDKNRFYWCCNGNDRYGSKFCNHRNTLDEEYLIQYIKDEIEKFKKMDHKAIFDEYIYVNFDSAEADKKVEELSQEIEKIQKMIKTNLMLLTDGIIDKEQYKSQNDELQAELKAKKNELNKYKTINQEITRLEAEFKDFIKYINEIDLENLTNAILKKIIKKIVVVTIEHDPFNNNERTTGISIHWNFIDGMNVEEIQRRYVAKIMNCSVEETYIV